MNDIVSTATNQVQNKTYYIYDEVIEPLEYEDLEEMNYFEDVKIKDIK